MYYLYHLITYWVCNLYYLHYDMKIWDNPEEWNKVKIQKWKPNIKNLWEDSTLSSLRNNIISGLIIYFVPKPDYFFDVSDFWYFLQYIIANDLYFYTIHYILHSKALYKYHKRHHKVAMTIAVSALDADVPEHIIGNLGSFFIPYYFIGGSKFLFAFVICFFTQHTCQNHSGYKRRNMTHDIHHQLLKYNFGNLGLIDIIMGTYKNTVRKNN